MDDAATRLLSARSMTIAIVVTILAEAFNVAVWNWQLIVLRSLTDNIARTLAYRVAVINLVGAATIVRVIR